MLERSACSAAASEVPHCSEATITKNCWWPTDVACVAAGAAVGAARGLNQLPGALGTGSEAGTGVNIIAGIASTMLLFPALLARSVAVLPFLSGA